MINAEKDEELTISLRRIPHHHTAKRREGLARGGDDVRERAHGLVTRASSGRGGWSADVDLDVRVGADGACPVIPAVMPA